MLTMISWIKENVCESSEGRCCREEALVFRLPSDLNDITVLFSDHL